MEQLVLVEKITALGSQVPVKSKFAEFKPAMVRLVRVFGKGDPYDPPLILNYMNVFGADLIVKDVSEIYIVEEKRYGKPRKSIGSVWKYNHETGEYTYRGSFY